VGQLFAVRDEMGDIDIAVIPANQHVVSDLVSIEVYTINLEGQYKFF